MVVFFKVVIFHGLILLDTSSKFFFVSVIVNQEYIYSNFINDKEKPVRPLSIISKEITSFRGQYD